MAHAYPPGYAEPTQWWVEHVRWERPGEGALPNEPSRTASYLECAMDFELSTGFKIGLDGATRTTLANKARVLAYTIRTLARIYGLEKNGEAMTLSRALEPRTDAAALTPLGAPLTSGYGFRPRWLSKWTTQAVAVNVWRARRDEAVNHPGNREACRGRRFAENWIPNCHSFPADDAWTAEANRTLKEALAAQKAKNKREFEVKMADPVRRRETAWTCDKCWTRAAYLTVEQADIRECQMRRGEKVDVGSEVYCRLCTKSLNEGGKGLDPHPTSGPKRRKVQLLSADAEMSDNDRSKPAYLALAAAAAVVKAAADTHAGEEGGNQGNGQLTAKRSRERPAASNAYVDDVDIPPPKWTRSQKAEGAPGQDYDGAEFIGISMGPAPSIVGTKRAVTSATINGACEGTMSASSSADAYGPYSNGASSSGNGPLTSLRCPSCDDGYRLIRHGRIPRGRPWNEVGGEPPICARCYDPRRE